MPSPRSGEDRSDFISRCMSDDKSKNSFPDQKQRTAFCFSQWKNKDKKEKKTAERYKYTEGVREYLEVKEEYESSDDK